MHFQHEMQAYPISRYREARLIPGLVLFRWDAPLFFANAELFRERVLDAVASSPPPVRWLVVAAEPVPASTSPQPMRSASSTTSYVPPASRCVLRN